MENRFKFWLNIRGQKWTKETATSKGSGRNMNKFGLSCNLCQFHPRVVGNDFGVEVGAVELVRAFDLMANIDLCHERAAENLLHTPYGLSPHAILFDNFSKYVVVLLKGADRPDDVVVMFHYSHSGKFYLLISTI